jgi:hypothetical protein
MMQPSPGLMACLNGTPVEFLHLVSTSAARVEEWLIHPLFVIGINRLMLFHPGDRLTPLHSKTR